ncbi:protein TolR [Methylomagnum ishizawai]|uniref:protein TolR n=1 Tax=Methylomagnum ishizawai TaxID=1760988 RepID=UPI001C32BD2A|nr:protein TolR [Methylomagnum ishizawai]BBL73794.1 protein TolR [Methylomagnum ishizawai]
MNVSTGKSRSGRRRPMAEINVVPYIDVSLVLLIIFMVTAPMLQTGVDVDLPQAEAKAVDPSQDLPIIISIKSDGSLYLDVGNQGDAEVADADLGGKVAEALAAKPGLAVLIRGDKAVDYGRVVTVMANLKNAGVPNVGLMTAPAEE